MCLVGTGSTITAAGVWAGRAIKGAPGVSAAQAAPDRRTAAPDNDNNVAASKAVRMMGFPFDGAKFNRKGEAASRGRVRFIFMKSARRLRHGL